MADDEKGRGVMDEHKETALKTAQRAARAMGVPYTDEDTDEALRARVREAWRSTFGDQSGAIVPPWLGSVLNEAVGGATPVFDAVAPHLEALSQEIAQALAGTVVAPGGPSGIYSRPMPPPPPGAYHNHAEPCGVEGCAGGAKLGAVTLIGAKGASE